MRLGLSIDVASSGLARARRSNPLYYALQYGLKLWLRASYGIQYGSTLRPGGTSPPAWTISGTATRQVGLHLEIDSVAGGTALGQATYKWSEDNGATYVATGVATAAGPTALGTTGLSVAMAAGPYNINNTWDITVAQWNDQSGNGNHLVQVTATAQPLFIRNITNGKPGLRLNGANNYMAKATTQILDGGAYTIMVAMRAVSIGAGRVYIGNQKADGSGGGYFGTDGVNRSIAHGGAFGATAEAMPLTWQKIVQRRAAGAVPTMRVNGAAVTVNSGGTGMNAATATASINLGANTPVTIFAPMEIVEATIWSSSLPDHVALALEQGIGAV